MSRALTKPSLSPLATLKRDVDGARRAAHGARSPATLEAYTRAWKSFRSWCASVREEVPSAQAIPAPPAVVAVYLWHISEERKYSPATIDLHIAAIVWGHRQHGSVLDRRAVAVADVRSNIRRTKGTKPRQARPLMVEDLEAICSAMGSTVIDKRDRAVLLVAFAGGFRSAELLSLGGLRVKDCKRTPIGYELTVRRSKTDQEGVGMVKHIPEGRAGTCPVAALDEWLKRRSATEGPLFVGSRGGKLTAKALTRGDLRRILLRRAERAGLDVHGFSGHSPRAGLVTEAVEAGVAVRDIMAVTGHKDVNVLEGYVRRQKAKVRPAAKGLL